MKKTIKLIICIAVITILLISTVFAAEAKKTIEVLMNTVNLTVNGKEVNADTIVYNGTTYVPLRAAAEMLGKEVGWDQTTQTASLNDKAVTTIETPITTWKQVKIFEGNTINNTESFKITSDEWRIVWESKANDTGIGYTTIVLVKAGVNDIKTGKVIGSKIGSGNEISYMSGIGQYYLAITSTQQYKITIEQK
jgi:ribosomal protein S19